MILLSFSFCVNHTYCTCDHCMKNVIGFFFPQWCFVNCKSKTLHWLYVTSLKCLCCEAISAWFSFEIQDESTVSWYSYICSLNWCQRCYIQVYFFSLSSFIKLWCFAQETLLKKNMLYNSVWVKIEKKHTIYSTVSLNTQS